MQAVLPGALNAGLAFGAQYLYSSAVRCPACPAAPACHCPAVSCALTCSGPASTGAITQYETSNSLVTWGTYLCVLVVGLVCGVAAARYRPAEVTEAEGDDGFVAAARARARALPG